jgi:hypothetical protein
MPEPPYPNKRTKGLNGQQQRPPGWVSTNNPLPSPVDRTATDHMNSHQGQPASMDRTSTTPSRTTYFTLIRDALAANPGGLSCPEILKWLETNRPDDFRRYDKDKLKTSILTALSAQFNKSTPTVDKYRRGSSERSPYIWKLANAMPSVEDASAGKASQVHPAGEHGHDGSEESPVQGSQVAPVNNAHTMTTHGQDNRRTDSTQTVGAGVRTSEDTQHKSSDTSRGVAYLLSQTAYETSATTRTSSLPPTQHPTGLQHESQSGATTTTPDTATSDTVHGSNCKEVLRLGMMVTQLQEMGDLRRRKQRKIDEERIALPDVKILEEDAKQEAEKVTELTRLLEEARRSAENKRKDLEVTRTKKKEIEADQREVEQIEADSKELRSQLGID